MQTLTRQVGQTFHIGDQVEVRILSIDGGRVRVGVVAPADMALRSGALRRRPRDAPPEPEIADIVERIFW